jgi:hypothetical protein
MAASGQQQTIQTLNLSLWSQIPFLDLEADQILLRHSAKYPTKHSPYEILHSAHRRDHEFVHDSLFRVIANFNQGGI